MISRKMQIVALVVLAVVSLSVAGYALATGPSSPVKIENPIKLKRGEMQDVPK